ncbi:HOOK2 protein, partial [Polypterus senegalus]
MQMGNNRLETSKDDLQIRTLYAEEEASRQKISEAKSRHEKEEQLIISAWYNMGIAVQHSSAEMETLSVNRPFLTTTQATSYSSPPLHRIITGLTDHGYMIQ